MHYLLILSINICINKIALKTLHYYYAKTYNLRLMAQFTKFRIAMDFYIQIFPEFGSISTHIGIDKIENINPWYKSKK